MEKKENNFKVKTIVLIGMFCAIAFVITLLSKLIPIQVAGFLTFDLKDVIVAICGFILGPLPAVIVTVVSSLIEMLTISATGPIGLLMNVLSTCAFAVPISIVYKNRKQFKFAIFGIILGIFCMTAIMLLWNWLITPLYMGVPRDVVVGMLLPVFLPFNLLKGGINGALTLLLYKPVVTALRKAKLVASSSQSQGPRKKLSVETTIVSIFVLASLVLVVLVWTKVI